MSSSEDQLNFANRTTNSEFHKRLLATQKASHEQQLEDSLFNEFAVENDEEEMRKKIAILQQQVDRMEGYVADLEEKLKDRKERRQKEANLTNMTPEQRAQYVMEEEERDISDIPDLDVIFEYMLLLGSSTTTDTNDLSQADFLKPDAQLREEAISDPDVVRQTDYSFVKFTRAKNILETRADSLGSRIKEEDSLDANIRDHVQLQLNMDAITPSSCTV
ncbi:hypothetical protein BCV71DRAFT_246044 [Rhizopus microsporus]|uniref:Uncharacterized protein n=1 Tax=Rhizopus microsporus TaxID=58291 RepID=A0A1X0RQ20_RHIZD|nr:hypothetical protein BCV71DRAFT_246044 [Rhizopus microsporus]